MGFSFAAMALDAGLARLLFASFMKLKLFGKLDAATRRTALAGGAVVFRTFLAVAWWLRGR
jgi:hypothetical protein